MAKLPQKIAHIVLGDVIGRGLNFAAGVYLARMLGTEAYGIITIALAFLFYSSWASDLGLSSIGIRETAKPIQNQLYYGLEIFVLKVTLAILVLSITLLILPHVGIPNDQRLVITRYIFALIPLALQVEWFFNGHQKFGLAALAKGISSGAYFLLILFFVKNERDLYTVPLLYIASMGISALIQFSFGMRFHIFEKGLHGIQSFKQLLKAAFSIGFGTFFGQMMQFLPPILIGIFLGTQQAGLYGAAFRIIVIGMMVDRVFVNILLPNFTQQWQQNPEATKINLAHTLRIMLVFGGSIALATSLLSPWVTVFLYGSEYAGGAPILAILGLFLYFTYLNSIFAFGLVALGKDHEYFKVMATGGILSVFMMFFAAMFFDLKLVAFAIALGELFIMLFSYFRFSTHIHLSFIDRFLATLMIAGGLHYLVSVLTQNAWLQTLFAIPSFVLLSYAFRVITTDDFRWMKTKLIR